MAEPITIPARFNGPLESGNGGYAGGALAPLVPGSAAISLRSPVPLDTPLTPVRGDGGVVRVMDGETLVAEVAPAPEVDLEMPEPVSLAEARAAARNYRGKDDGPFSQCFVCGRPREDSFGVFAGAVAGRDVVASPWVPPEWAADGGGTVRPEFIWAALDCPTYFALYPDSYPLSFLARMSVRIDGPVRAGEEHVVMAWPIEKDGRKHHAGAAVLSAGGETLAVAQALLIDTGGTQPG
jgi:hypothetical protein